VIDLYISTCKTSIAPDSRPIGFKMYSSVGFAILPLLIAVISANGVPVRRFERYLEAARGIDLKIPTVQYLPLKDSRSLPARSTLKARLQPDAVRTRIRYGPYALPSVNDTTLLSMLGGERGAIDTIHKVDAVCNDCLVLYGKVTLENEDGSLASLSQGTYFHHAAMVNLNEDRKMYTCSGKNESKAFALGPAQFIIGVSDDGENWFTDKPTGTYKSGYYITPKDEFILMVQVMNYSPVKKVVYMNYEVEYMPGKPAGWANTLNPILNVAPCGLPKVDFKVPSAHYAATSKPWRSTINGTIINVLGHLHDGGESVSVRLNGKEICLSKAVCCFLERLAANLVIELWNSTRVYSKESRSREIVGILKSYG
jgi:hypothetical protein